MKTIVQKIASIFMVLAVLGAGPGVAYRCDMKCSLTDEAARFCLNTTAREQALYEAEHGHTPWFASSECMGVERVDSTFTSVNEFEVRRPDLGLVAITPFSSSVISPTFVILHGGIDPPGFSPDSGLAAIPSQHAPPAGSLFV